MSRKKSQMMSASGSGFGQDRDAERRHGKLGVGDEAPDFSLRLLDEHEPDISSEVDAARVSLSGFLGKRPAVLIFGSFTCYENKIRLDFSIMDDVSAVSSL